MFKKNTPCIKHKLWGRLKSEAKHKYRIFPRPGCNLFEIKSWCVDEYLSYSSRFYRNFDDAVVEVERLRDEYFERICFEVLYERRCERCENL